VYTPPKEEYKPPPQEYTPPKEEYKPPPQEYTPPKEDYGYGGGGCKDGAFQCAGKNAFQKCDHSKWVDFQCPYGTECYDKGSGLILCDWPKKSYY